MSRLGCHSVLSKQKGTLSVNFPDPVCCWVTFHHQRLKNQATVNCHHATKDSRPIHWDGLTALACGIPGICLWLCRENTSSAPGPRNHSLELSPPQLQHTAAWAFQLNHQKLYLSAMILNLRPQTKQNKTVTLLCSCTKSWCRPTLGITLGPGERELGRAPPGASSLLRS